MKILITGSSGAVGSYLTENLGTNHEIVSLSRDADEHNQSSYAVDLVNDQERVAEIFARERPDAVIHLAALIGAACEADPKMAERVNVDATRYLAELAITFAVQRFIFFSTGSAYNQTDFSPISEVSDVDPQNIYSKTKIMAEQAISSVAAGQSETQFISFRPFNIYGPNFRKSLIYLLIHSSPESPVSLWNMHHTFRDYVHVSDIVQATQSALSHNFDAPHTILNLGSGIVRNNSDVVKEIESNGITPSYITGEQDELSLMWADISRAKKEIDFNPSQTLIIDR